MTRVCTRPDNTVPERRRSGAPTKWLCRECEHPLTRKEIREHGNECSWCVEYARLNPHSCRLCREEHNHLHYNPGYNDGTMYVCHYCYETDNGEPPPPIDPQTY